MFIRNLIDYIRIRKIISEVLKEENLLSNLSKIFSNNNHIVTFKQDWIGRIYAVINPVVQDPNSRIFEYDGNGTNLKSFVNKWVVEHMIAADNFVKNHQLFDILVYDIKQLDDDYNFLITLTPIAWYDFWKSTKILLSVIAILAIIGIALLFIL